MKARSMKRDNRHRAPEYVEVKDLESFQHYSHRCPPWVKLHWSLLDNHAFLSLNETDRHRFIMCILVASRVQNRIRNDPNYLARLMRLTDPIDLTPLINCGLLLACRKQPASNTLAPRQQNALSEQSISEKRILEERRAVGAVDTVNNGENGLRIVSTVSKEGS